MARLNSYYTLCPLIDQQNLLGVETDSEPGCAIVTLGRNIVIRYKVDLIFFILYINISIFEWHIFTLTIRYFYSCKI